uniref:Coat protein n=1 Tax=Tobacco streak virus TaxID=12317 RepID=B2CBB2_9BROM|nr:coat protein [Tobacco streak virus]ACJ66610.1 coat protein [Tobacco streak virus]AGN29711.1 coat protein [Tobacco streak virus]
MKTLNQGPDHPSNVMSSRANNRNGSRCPTCFDELDALARNCSLHSPARPTVSRRQRRNAARAAAYRNANAARVPLPVPVVPVSRPQARASLKLPNNQVWVTRKASEWAAKATDTNDAISFRVIAEGIPGVDDETKFFRLLIGFVAVSDGTFGMVDGVTGETIPDPPVVGRLGFKKNTYRSRDFDLGGKTLTQLSDRAIVWCLDENRREAKRVQLAGYWLAISKPAPLMPPEDFLVNQD